MALTKTRKIGKLLNNNFQIDVIDSERINVSLNKGVNIDGDLLLFDTSNDLPGNQTTGRKAYVLSTKTLYIYNGSGWYRIATVNNFNPQWITPPDSDYTLELISIDSDVKIIVYATDSDQVPITYTATVDSDFNVAATITHDSDKDPVWIVRRRDSESGAGTTGNVTFKASDGVNLVSFVSTFTVSSNTAAYEGSPYQGTSRAYVFAGSYGTDIQKVSYASDGNATDVGDLHHSPVGHTEGVPGISPTHGYILGGRTAPSPSNNYPTQIARFPYASEGNSADSTYDLGEGYGSANSTAIGDRDKIYITGGSGGPGAKDHYERITHSSLSNSTDVGFLTPSGSGTWGQFLGGASSQTKGYTLGGRYPFASYGTNAYYSFPFASEGNMTDTANLTTNRYYTTGNSSNTHGYTVQGRRLSPPTLRFDLIDKFPFASEGNATDVGNDTYSGARSTGSSAPAYGYVYGGASAANPSDKNDIRKHSFASDGDASDVGDLVTSYNQGQGAADI